MQQQARIQAAKYIAARAGADFVLLSAPENIYYFSGFRTTIYTRFSGILVPARDGDPVLVIPSLEYSLATDAWWSPSWYETAWIRTYGPSKEHKDHFAVIADVIPPGSTVGVDAMSYAAYVAFSARVPGVKAVPVYDEANAAKQVKTPAEIEALKKANEISLAGFEHIKRFLSDAVAAGREVTEVDVALEMDFLAKRMGADGFGYPTLVSWGDKMMAPHSPPLLRPIAKNELVRVAFGPTYDGYSADLVRTLVIGQPPELLLKLRDAYKLGREACFKALVPGATVAQVIDAVAASYEAAGVLDAWDFNAGHGIGITIHELPRIARGNEGTLREGMVIAVEPVVEYGPIGYNHCDVVLVTAKGGVNLAPGLDDVIAI